MMRKIFKIFVLVFIAFLACCFFFRENILKSIGNFLISEDEIQNTEVVFVLGGESFDRGNLAVKIFKEGFSEKVICLGENVPNIFKALGMSYAESEVTKINILKNNIPDSCVFVLKKGTSTKEEIDAIIDYCKSNDVKKIMLVTDKFHTRRVRMIFGELFEENNIQLILCGAQSTIYSEEEWWKTEGGLIMVNNEYVKLMYYRIKY